jgi:hypothetical protein
MSAVIRKNKKGFGVKNGNQVLSSAPEIEILLRITVD